VHAEMAVAHSDGLGSVEVFGMPRPSALRNSFVNEPRKQQEQLSATTMGVLTDDASDSVTMRLSCITQERGKLGVETVSTMGNAGNISLPHCHCFTTPLVIYVAFPCGKS
jgi:hypothetical protein